MPDHDTTPIPDALVCDFTSGAVRHRFLYGGGRGQALPRAVGMKGGKNPLVADATAGLGGDAFLLASLGATVILMERAPALQALLEAGLAQALAAGGEVAAVVGRMTLLKGDARDLLPALAPDMIPDVVLVDPMHPPRNKSALVKNEMRLIRDLVGADDDSLGLMLAALAVARNRVVLKWPRRAAPMAGLRAPSHRIMGKTTRYDVFMTG